MADKCTCAGTAPGYPQHEPYCGKPETGNTPGRTPAPAGAPGGAYAEILATTAHGTERLSALLDAIRDNPS